MIKHTVENTNEPTAHLGSTGVVNMYKLAKNEITESHPNSRLIRGCLDGLGGMGVGGTILMVSFRLSVDLAQQLTPKFILFVLI